MKKLAFAAAALAAGVAMADGSIQSANVVGYQQKELRPEANSFVAMTLMPVGKEMADVKLSDFVPTDGVNGWSFDSDYLATMKSNGTFDKKFGYVSSYWANRLGDAELAGWHLYDNLLNGNFKGERLDDTKIPFGTGVAVYTDNENVTLTFSGEVLADDYGIPLRSEANTFTGVICPADVTLAELGPTGGVAGWSYDTDYIATMKSNGTFDKKFGYLSPYWADRITKGDETETETITGWHLYNNLLNGEFYGERCGDEPFKAGQALVVYTSMEDVELVVPSALP